jgi:hypothetical protein
MHQLDEDRPGLAVVGALVGVLYLAAGTVSGVMIRGVSGIDEPA